jgi:cardiolipin synthase A/B
VTHEKSIVVDEQAALVATFNLMEKYFTLTRDYGIITDDPYHVSQIVEVFNADWDSAIGSAAPMKACCGAIPIRVITWRNSLTRPPSGWMSSIRNMWTRSFSNGSRRRLIVVSKCTLSVVVSTASVNGILDTFASLRTLKRFGVRVHKQKNLRVHAKLIVVDNAHTLVGSMNIDRSAFDLRRELGIMTNDPAIVGRLTEVFDSDWDLSHHYEAPDPLDPPQHHEDDFPHDKDLMHE